MKKTKFKLEDLKVKSFVTASEDTIRSIRGGANQYTLDDPNCQPTATIYYTLCELCETMGTCIETACTNCE